MPRPAPQTLVGLKILLLPEDVRAQIRATQADIDTLEATVATCPNLDPTTLAAWDAFVAEWAAFDKDVSLLPIRYQSQYGDAVDFQMRARAWEPVLKEKCGGLRGPSIQPTGGSGLAAVAGSTWTGIEIGLGAAAVLGLGALLILKKR